MKLRSHNFEQLWLAAIPWLFFIIACLLLCHLFSLQSTVQVALANPAQPAAARYLWLLVPAALAGPLAIMGITSMGRLVLILSGVTAACVLASLYHPLALAPFLALPLLHVLRYFRRRSPEDSRRLHLSVLTLLLTLCAAVRAHLLFTRPDLGADPDLGSYLQIAANQRGWSTLFREPLYIWVLQIVKLSGGQYNPLMAQLTAILMSLGATAALYLLCLLRFSTGVAIIAAALYATVPYVAQLSVRGLREDAIVLTTLLFVYIAWNHLSATVTWKSLTLLGTCGAACALLRFSSFSFALLLILLVAVIHFYHHDRTLKRLFCWVYPVAIVVGLTLPYIMHCRQTYGQPFFLANWAARFYANEEFGGKHPDFPTLAELEKDAYTGPVITPREYVFKYHTLSQVAERISFGFIKVFFGLFPRVQQYFASHLIVATIFYALHVLGLIWLLHLRRVFFLLAMLVFHAPLFFLAASPTFDPRLLVLSLVLIMVSLASAISFLLSFAINRYRRRHTRAL